MGRRPATRSFTDLLTRRNLRIALGVAVVLLVALAAWLFLPFWQLSGQFGSAPTQQPSRLYGAPPVVEPGGEVTRERIVEHLRSQGYREVASTPPHSGTFRRDGGSLEIYRRVFPSPRGPVGGDLLRVGFRGRRVASLVRLHDGSDEVAAKELSGVWLDPPLVASYYGPGLQDRRPVELSDLPEDMILAVLAAEDSNFLEHLGVSPLSILRAAWVNVRAGGVVQGGSTLTQQLVKNIYLTHERRIQRKVREALLSVLLELRYEKSQILQAYLNEIYWGRSGSVDVMGVGAAAWAYFRKRPAELTLGECALLAGMIQSPARLDPTRHPEAARARRDEVLGRLAQLDWVEDERAAAAAERPVEPWKKPLLAREAPYFADFAAEEASVRFSVSELADAGYVLHSTLSLHDQRIAEEQVDAGLQALEAGWEKNRASGTSLQAALVSLDPEDGAVLAYVGGRDYATSQFDRVRSARRQAGSSFKPIVYAAAFESRSAHPSSFLEDAPYTVELADRNWSPQNSDGEYHGWVTAREALERSLNVPTARLAVRVGLGSIVDMAGRLGVESELDPYPALALGAMEVTPLELATVYSTLAAGGVRTRPHALVSVFDRQGNRLEGEALPEPRRVLDADVAYVLTRVLQGVIDHGTGRAARRDGLLDPLAGKTGTTNSRRDSWFAGYAPERATLVWVGYDDNSRTRLSGSRAALPIWTAFTYRVRPPGGFAEFPMPDGIVLAEIDPRTGGLAHFRCSERREEVFLADFLPGPLCADDDPFWRQRRGLERRRPDRRNPFERILDVLRGRGGGEAI